MLTYSVNSDGAFGWGVVYDLGAAAFASSNGERGQELLRGALTPGGVMRVFDEILSFAEVEEYIDQPMKTYSTGMCSRLMFNTSPMRSSDSSVTRHQSPTSDGAAVSTLCSSS